MSHQFKRIWVLYDVTDVDTLKNAAGISSSDELENFCSAIFTAETSLENTHGIKILGIWDYQNPNHTINPKMVERNP